MHEYIEVCGAGVTDYKSGKAMRADWEAGADFRILTVGYPTYISIRNARPNLTVHGRFRNLQGLVTLSGK